MPIRRQSNWIAGVLASALLLLAAGTQAQETDPATEPITDLPEVSAPEVLPVPQGIESIEITGERDITNVQDQAEAITRFDMSELDKLNITNVDGLASNVPGLHVGQQGQAAIITLRGVGTENASLTGESGVAFHVDGMYYGRPTAARVAFYDLEMIDVKRGPQGLLGGKNSTSGTIQISTRDPQMGEYGAEGDYLLGNYDRARARGAINIPLGELVAARVAMFMEERDGYLDLTNASLNPTRHLPPYQVWNFKKVSKSDDPFDADNFGIRGKLRFAPSDSLDMVVGYHWFREDGNGPQADLVPLTDEVRNNRFIRDPNDPLANNPNPCIIVNQSGGGEFQPPSIGTLAPNFRSTMPDTLVCQVSNQARPPRPPPGFRTSIHTPAVEDADPRKIWSEDGLDPDQRNRYWGLANKLNWDVPDLPLLGATHLKTTFGYQRTETGFLQDFDSSSLQVFQLETSSEVEEYGVDMAWTGELAERLEWQTSLFFTHEKGDSFTVTPELGGSDTGGGTIPPSAGGGAFVKTFQNVNNKSYGAALHGDYHLTDSLTFSLGGRWIKDVKRSFLRDPVDAATVEACKPAGNREDWPVKSNLPECEATFRGTMWGSRLEFRPTDDHTLYLGLDRGYKSGGFALGGVGNYDPEKIWAYSIGSKSEFFDQRLQLNLEAFYYDYSDLQIALVDGTGTRTENTEAEMSGWEIESRLTPIDGLNLRAVLNYLHTETIDYYSLDPATFGNRYQENRLTTRTIAERRGVPFTDYLCVTPPDEFGSSNRVPCGNIGTSPGADGLDDYSGNSLSRSPEWKATFSGEYEIPLGRFGVLIPHVQYAWQDDTYFRAFNTEFDLQEAYHKTDAKLMWESPEQMWSAEVFVENIEDKAVRDYILVGSSVFSSPLLAWYGAPRFYGFRVGFKY